MKLVVSQSRIIELMSRFVAQIEGSASMGKMDLNKAAETILIPLLNEVYGWSLENINYSEDNNNYPGIDLADAVARICIQVTSTPKLDKVKHTLQQFAKHRQHLKYDRLIIYILKDKQDSYSEQPLKEIIKDRFNFDPRKDIWDHHNILKEVSNFQVDKTLRVQGILEANFGGEKQSLASSVGNLEQTTDWRETCRELLNHWKGLTTNILTKRNGVRFQLDEIFVLLGMVERQQKPKHRFDGGSPEQGSELYEEKITPISQDDFFEQVLRQRQSETSQESRTAIIGEPGAGKTTQLQKIGDWILKETDGIPIWISLAAIGTKPLREYLLNDWLQTATQELEIPQRIRDELGELLKTGKVWLLLDGVDEMAIADALHQVATQMREGWLQKVRVVLTCRLNVWDVGKNALDGFDVYRNLDFDYPTQVHEFIDRWFVTEPELQQKLKLALEQPCKERIQDMVKNPLRLTLLCYSWHLRQGELPETKAGLYEWFTDTFYEWNKGKIHIKLSTAKRKELNHALGELAKAAIDQTFSRFRLREKFVNPILGDVDDEESLFYLARQLGWLNCVGVAEENLLEDVYAFFHPTFQEYFAALAIEDWDFFLNPVHTDPHEGSYRVFESQWEEVFLLWLGRENTFQKDKESLIEALIEFDDLCGSLYQYRTYCLAALGLSEFIACSSKARILKQVINWYFGYFNLNIENKKLTLFLSSKPMNDLFRLALVKTDREALIESLADLATKSSHTSIRRAAAHFLGIFGAGNLKAAQALVYLVKNSVDKQVWQQAVESLGEIGDKMPEVFDVLNDHILNSQDKEEQLQIAKSLGKFDPGNLNAIRVLVEALLISEDSFGSSQIGWMLREFDVNKIAIKTLSDSLAISQNEHENQLVNEKLTYIDPNHLEANNNLREILRSNCDDLTKFNAAISLLKVNAKEFDAISTLINLLQNTQDIEIRKQSIVGLGVLAEDSLDAVDALSNLLYLEQDETTFIHASEMLKRIGFGNRNAILSLTQLLQTNQNSELQYHYAECLGEIDPGNPKAISTLAKLLSIESDNESKLYAIDRISRIGTHSLNVRDIFLNLLDSDQSPCVRLEATWNLWLCFACNFDATYILISDQLFNGKDKKLCHLAAWRLKHILQDNLFQNTVTQLAKSLPMTALSKDFELYKIYFDLALFCIQQTSYLDFYNAWHSEPNITS